MTDAQDKINLFKRLSMTSADVKMTDRIRLQKHVPRAGSFEVYFSPITFIAHTKYLKA